MARTVCMDLAEKLADSMSAKELRQWMRRHEISRSRGASKLQSARCAVEQKPDIVESFLGLGGPVASTHCMCGYEEYFDEESKAITAAKRHSVRDESCNAKAWSAKGPLLYGQLGR